MLPKIIVCLTLTTFAAGAQETLAQTRALLPSGGKQVSFPPFEYYDEAQCDDDGNLYFHVDRGNYGVGEILKISPDGQTGNLFKLSGKFSDPANAFFTNFSVTRAGDVYVLAGGPSEQAYLFSFDNLGVMKDHPVLLEIPPNVIASNMIVFDDGSTLLSGHFGEKALPKMKGKRYVAILDASGRPRRTIDTLSADVDLAELRTKISESGASRSADGTVYILAQEQVTSVSQTGERLGRIRFSRPNPKSLATNIRVSEGLASIGFSTFDKSGSRIVKREFLVLDLTSGKPLAVYEASEQLGYNDVCFSRTDGFTFLRSDDGQIKLLKAQLR